MNKEFESLLDLSYQLTNLELDYMRLVDANKSPKISIVRFRSNCEKIEKLILDRTVLLEKYRTVSTKYNRYFELVDESSEEFSR